KAVNGQFLPIGGNFGLKCKIFWLPDTFGYSAQLPQIIKGAGLNSPIQHFIGLELMVVSYVGQCYPSELIRSVKNHKDKEWSNEALLLFGNGDGGGGPLASMIERLRRLKDIDGLPKVEIGSADDFYERVERNSSELVSWKGELVPTHRMGRLNNIIANWSFFYEIYPKDILDKLWKYVLLNQFHDVLPGSSIGMVYDDANKFYEELPESAPDDKNGLFAFNTLGWSRTEVVELPINSEEENTKSRHDVEGMGLKAIDIEENENVDFVLAEASINENFYFLINQFISVKFDKHCRLISLFDKRLNREIIPIGRYGNSFKCYEDIPIFWDAWDGRDVGLGGSVKIHEVSGLRASLLLETKLSDTSTLRQVISITAFSCRVDFETTVDWNENRQFLKVEFPFDITSDYATYETQFGFVQRPTHFNTSWDAAKFEVCGHKFADLSEYGYGVALLNDCKYGKLSLLRSPKAPDDNCDIGVHKFKYAIFPHIGSFLESNVVHEAYQFNVPLLVKTTSQEIVNSFEPKTYFNIENAPNVILNTIKRAEDSDDIILRLYEAYGGQAVARLRSSLQIDHIYETNILEDNKYLIDYTSEDGAIIKFKPFQIITLKIVLS
ncbi:8292_t:CDS:10, partial [Diversispora eburnea]